MNAAVARERRLVTIAALIWLAVLGAALAALNAGLGPLDPALVWALGLMAVPAVASVLVLHHDDGPRRRALLLVLWAVAGALACALTGGLSGPLTPWCLAPVVAATLLGRRRLMAEAAALAVLGAALAAVAQAAGIEPQPPTEPLRFLLGLFALATLGLSLATGLVRAGHDQDDTGARSDAETLLIQQPHLILSLTAEGEVLSAYGYAPAGVTEKTLAKGLKAVVDVAELSALTDALDSATRGNAVEMLCDSGAAPGRTTALSIRASTDGRLYAVVRDATAQQARESVLVEARQQAEQLNSGKSQFLANMSHELRTPLNTIMGFSDIMKARLFGPMPAKYGEYAELIHESGAHLLALINDVLDMSKIEAERFQLSIEEFDVRDPLAAALRLMRVQADEAGVFLRAVLPPEAVEVEADPRALKQIALNLLSNALKFTPRGGQVTATLSVQGDGVELVVADTGVGIAAEDLKRLGRPYEQAGDAGQRARGTGLGLSLVRGLSELHGGDMIIESTLGEGTSVTVRLPGVILAKEADPRPSAQVIAFNPGR
jgi:cell cycle sensor histidine kinase DivJ